MDEILEYIPLVGDIYRAGRLGYKAGSYIGELWYGSADDKISKAQDALDNALSLSGTQRFIGLSHAYSLFSECECDKKYKYAIVLYGGAVCQYLAAAETVKMDGMNPLKYLHRAKQNCHKVKNIEISLLTAKRKTIKEIQEHTETIIPYIKSAYSQYSESIKGIYPWRYFFRWIVPLHLYKVL